MKAWGWAGACIGLYGLAVVVLWRSGASPVDLATTAAIFGLALPWLAARLGRDLAPATAPPRPFVPAEGPLLTLLIVFAAAFIAFKPAVLGAIPGTDGPRGHALANLLAKLLVFVALPLIAYRARLGWHAADFGLRPAWRQAITRRSVTVFAVMAAACTAMQAAIGAGAQPVLRGDFSAAQLAVALPLSFVWLALEAGLVEEFFFRVLLQSRINAWCGSSAGAVGLSALWFGLAHVPGLALRGGGEIEGLGAAPSLILTTAYAIATLSLAGVFLGILWDRSRNVWLIVAVHAAIDLLPNTPELIHTWHL